MRKQIRLLFASLAVFSGLRGFAVMKLYLDDQGMMAFGSDISEISLLASRHNVSRLEKGQAATPATDVNDGAFLASEPVPARPGRGASADLSIVLVRSIGNPLPPRHDSEQAIRSLNFTLCHEQKFLFSQRHWVLNRLVNSSLESKLTAMLDDHGENYTIIPFDLKKYSEIPLVFPVVEEVKDVIHSTWYQNLTNPFQRSCIDGAMHHDRVLYATNVNEARNQMVEIGLSLYNVDWVFPLDGNCFFTPEGYSNILRVLQRLRHIPSDRSSSKYVTVPMVRLTEPNEVLLDGPRNDAAEAVEEPQVIFHRTSNARFHPRLRYGRANKLEMLKRLRVPGQWDEWIPYPKAPLPWDLEGLDPPFMQPISDLHPNASVLSAGWVYRLFSGNAEIEKQGASQNRSSAREMARFLFLGDLDSRVVKSIYNFSEERLLYYDDQQLREQARNYQQSLSSKTALLQRADEVVASLSFSAKPRNGCNQTELSIMQTDVTELALAHRFSMEEQYGQLGAQIVRTWFLNETSRLRPDFQRSCGGIGPSNFPATMNGLFYMLDAIRLLHGASYLTKYELQKIRSWFQMYMDVAANSQDFFATNHRGVFYDIQMVAISSFLGKFDSLVWFLDTSLSRLQVQLREDGAMVHELESASYCERNQINALQAWSVMAHIASQFGRNLWQTFVVPYKGLKMPALCAASHYAVPFFRDRKVCSSEALASIQDWKSPWLEAKEHCPLLKDQSLSNSSWLNEMQSNHSRTQHVPEGESVTRSHRRSFDWFAPFAHLALGASAEQHI